jgi:hypothetical protein
MLTGRVTNAIESVKNSPASIFTKEDVIKLLATTMDETIPTPVNDETEVEPTITLTLSQFEDMMQDVADLISDYEDQSIDSNDITYASFDIDGDRISIQDINIQLDTDELADNVSDTVKKYINFDLAK